MQKSMVWLCLLLSAWACSTPQKETQAPVMEEKPSLGNPAAEGFNETGSDAKAIALADSVMEAMGGRAAWDQTRYLTWTFFGRRTHLWDRYTGDVRIESPDDSTVYLTNVLTGVGQVVKAGIPVTDSTERASGIERARRIWINDSYWLVMPFKLKDSGVTLTYNGMVKSIDSVSSHQVSLSFDGVGVTPENLYMVYIDPESYLVTQWDYYADAADTEAYFQIPWLDYQPYGGILLSGERKMAQLTDIAVLDSVPAAAFTQWDFNWR